MRRISLETPIPELIKKLEEIERYSAQQILRTILQQLSYQAFSGSISSAEIEKLNNKIAFLQAQLAQPVQVHPKNNEALEKMYIRAVRLGMPPDVPRDLTSLDNYINDELIKRLDVANTNNANYVKLFKQMVNVIKKLNKSGHKPTCKTSKTKKKKSKNKSKKKKKSKSGQVYTARVDEQSDSDSSNNDTSSSESENSSSSSESSSSKSESEAEADAEINVNIFWVKKK